MADCEQGCAAARACVAWLAGESRYKNFIVAEGGDFGSRYSAPGLRYGAAMHHDTTQEACDTTPCDETKLDTARSKRRVATTQP